LEFLDFLIFFQKYKIFEKKYKADKIEERAEPCPIPISMLKEGKERLF